MICGDPTGLSVIGSKRPENAGGVNGRCGGVGSDVGISFGRNGLWPIGIPIAMLGEETGPPTAYLDLDFFFMSFLLLGF